MHSSLSEVNQRILLAEKSNEPDKVRDLLSDDLVFRRANTQFVDKKTFLDQMTRVSYSHLEQTSFEVIPMTPESACVILQIDAKGKRPDKTEFEGQFRNVRFFRKVEEQWKLYAWRNDSLEKGRIAPLTDRDKFSGIVVADKLEERNLPDGGRWQQVLFHGGARTHWHVHPEGQDLFILAGKALVVISKSREDEEITSVNAGEQIHIAPGAIHWHGATKDSFMVHIAHNAFSYSSETSYWFDPVNEEQYDRAHESIVQ